MANRPGMLNTQLDRRVRQLESQLKQARRAVDQELPAEAEAESWLLVYLDMMTLLLVMLVVLLAFAGKAPQAQSEHAPATPPLEAIVELEPLPMLSAASTNLIAPPFPAFTPPQAPQQASSEEFLAGLDMSGLSENIEVIRNQGRVSFRISSEIIFAPAQTDLSLAGLGVLRQLVPVLLASGHRISVAGHTDAVPIRNVRYPSNWELSGARAGSVVRYLEANGVPSARLTAVGHADTRPLAENTSSEGRSINRRVELTLEKPQP